ncbi:MAG TPA: hypothetical protein VJU17_00445 [Gemmatimonadales bacterium]|nr:hypothetical protein [Gemmatimonadales bacterium]
MKMNAPTRYATLAALLAGLACAGNKADTDQSAAAKDTTTTTTGRDTLNGQTENPPGYRGMERDTTQAPVGQTPSDTFLQNQGTGTPQDTAGYSGIERVDTTGQARTDTTNMSGQDTSGVGGQDTTGAAGADTSSMNQSSNQNSGAQLDSTGQSQTGDTTGYGQSQQGRDSTNR